MWGLIINFVLLVIVIIITIDTMRLSRKTDETYKNLKKQLDELEATLLDGNDA